MKRSREGNFLLPSVSSSPSTSSTAGGVYEVFLSFCGKDTRNGFTDFLYTYLVGASIQTFRDDNELRVGEEISHELLEAIKKSKIAIPIFSQNYASSKWCLLELQQIVDCHENGGQMIYPIFYDVDPSDVRNQRGSYEMAFIQHTKNFREETVQKWRKSLRVVGELKGLELEKETNGRQGELVKRVVEEVVLRLKKNYTPLPENLVGMELLDVDSNHVHIVGIHGMGGLGKTTIAKVIYNKLCERFESQCFLYDVREKSKHSNNGIVDLQKQIISKILNRRDDSFSEVNEGRRKISDAFCGKKFLLVLDDVDENYQVEMLVGDLKGYKAQSRIILTTRDKEVLHTIEGKNQNVICRSYEPDGMDNDNALQLFSKYAFMRDTPMEGYQIHSKEVVKIAAGLPLVLVVLGSTFFLPKAQDLWEEKLRQLRKIPHDQVLKKLRISFDALNDDEKEIFLDIACFFIGNDMRKASYMWEDCEFYPKLGIRVLISKSMIKVGDNNELIMHDQLRDLGRQIVFEEGKKKPWKRSRLWDTKDVLQTLKTNQDTSSVNAISLDNSALCHDLTGGISVVASDFENLPNLRYLSMYNVEKVQGDFEHLLPNLRWFQCIGKKNSQSERAFPSNLNMENLVVLHISNYVLRTWDGWNKLKMIKNLKSLDLSYCEGTPALLDLSNLTKLVELDLSYCEGTPALLDLSNLTKLVEVQVTGCRNLTVIQGLDKLESLERLDASCCSKLILIEGVQKLTSLEYLDLYGCWKLIDLGDLSNLKKLQVLEAPGLHFSNMKKLKVRSYNNRGIIDIPNLYGLEELEFDYCPFVVKLPDLSACQKLKDIDVSECGKLSEILGLEKLVSLEKLSITKCSSIEALPDLSACQKLKDIDVSECGKLSEILGLEKLVSLEKLSITKCSSIEALPDLSACQKLKDIDVSECGKLSEILGLEKLVSLEKLSITKCSSIEALPDLSACQKLKDIDVSECGKLSEILGLEKLVSLEKLSITKCSSIEALPDLSACQKLKDIDVSECWKLSEILGLEKLVSLEKLSITKCSSIEALPDLSAFQKLKDIDVSECWKLSEILGLEKLVSLEKLSITKCSSIEALPDLSACQKLKDNVSECWKLSEILGLEKLVSLEKLSITKCSSIEALPDLSACQKLKDIDVSECWKLSEILGLEKLVSLEKLSITKCSSIEALPDLSACQKLKDIDVSECWKLSEILGLEKLVSLEKLSITKCSSIEALPDLSACQKIKEIDVSECEKLSEILGLEELKSLNYLDVRGCKRLGHLPNLAKVEIKQGPSFRLSDDSDEYS